MASLALNTTPLEWVRAFEAAGRTGSFTNAATELNVTQAAISQRIKSLEDRIGRALFLRGARGITLTVDGEAWLPYVTAAIRDLNESFEDIFGTARETVTLSASASVIALWLAPRLHGWADARRPQINFSTRVLSSPQHQGPATVEIEYGTGDWPDYRKSPLFAEAMSPVAAPALLGTDDWQALPRIAVSGPRAGWQDWARFAGDPAIPTPHLRFDSFAAALSAAIAGQGVLLASLPLCAAALSEGQIVRLSPRALDTPQTYWMRARQDAITQRSWAQLCAQFLDPQSGR